MQNNQSPTAIKNRFSSSWSMFGWIAFVAIALVAGPATAQQPLSPHATSVQAGEFQLTVTNGSFVGRITVDGAASSPAIIDGTVAESTQRLYLVADYEVDEATFVYIDVIAADVYGIAAGDRVGGGLAQVRAGKGQLRQQFWQPPKALIPGRYRVDVLMEDGPEASLSLNVEPVAPPARPIQPFERPPGHNVALSALGGTVTEANSPGSGTAWTAENLIDGFARTYDESGAALAKGWHNDPRAGLPAELVFSFYQGRQARIGAVVIDTAGIDTEPVIPGAPKHVEVLVSDDNISTNFRAVAEARLWPIYGPQIIRFDPVDARFLRLRIRSAYRNARYVAIGEVSIYESAQSPSIVADLPHNIASPALGGHIERYTSEHPNNKAWNLVDGKVGEDHAWVSADPRPDEAADLPQEFVFTFNHGRAALIERLEIDADGRPRNRAGDFSSWRPKTVSIAVRDESSSPFRELSTFPLEQQAGTQAVVIGEQAQALRLRVLENFGGPSTLIGEVRIIEGGSLDVPSVASMPMNTPPDLNRSVTDTPADSNEDNNSQSTATAMPLDQAIDGTLDTFEDRDWFSLEVGGNEPQLLNIELDGHPGLRTQLELVGDTSAASHVYIPPSDVGSQDRLSWLVAPGKHWISVRSLPLHVVIVWDSSSSMKGRTDALESAVHRYLAKVGADERLQLIRFSNEVEVLLDDFTGNYREMAPAIDGKFTASGSTALGDALRSALDLLDDVSGRRAVVFFTDGHDSSSSKSLVTLLDRVGQADVQIYTVGLGEVMRSYSRRMSGTGVHALHSIARQSGGRFFFATDKSELREIFDDIARELREVPQYSIRPSLSKSTGELAVTSLGDPPSGLAPPRVELILDGSGSMRTKVADGRTRMQVAREVLKNTVLQIPPDVKVALRVFGHRIAEGAPGDCEDSELLAPHAPDQADTLSRMIDGIRPLGTTLIAHSLRQAIDTLGDDEDGLVVLVTDGEEECNDDLTAAVDRLRQVNPRFHLNIVGFEIDDSAVRDELARVAELTGGTFIRSEDGGALQKALLATLRPTFAVTDHSGNVVGRGLIDGEPITIPVGRYKLRIDSTAALLDETAISIQDDRTTTVRLTEAGSRIAVNVSTD